MTKTSPNNPFGSELTKSIFISLLTSFLFIGVLYFLMLKNILNFLPKYGFFLFFTILSYAIILPSITHIRSYKEFPCMSGMMVGMTIGMISGFLPGFYIAATNGMFYGSVFGMSIGILFGILNGKCCGIMGAMEGIMAGFMGGLMGAMTAFMLLNDHLRTSGVIVFAISSAIILGLNIMIKKESSQLEKIHSDNTLFTIVWNFILTLATLLLMVFGPRSTLFQ